MVHSGYGNDKLMMPLANRFRQSGVFEKVIDRKSYRL